MKISEADLFGEWCERVFCMARSTVNSLKSNQIISQYIINHSLISFVDVLKQVTCASRFNTGASLDIDLLRYLIALQRQGLETSSDLRTLHVLEVRSPRDWRHTSSLRLRGQVMMERPKHVASWSRGRRLQLLRSHNSWDYAFIELQSSLCCRFAVSFLGLKIQTLSKIIGSYIHRPRSSKGQKPFSYHPQPSKSPRTSLVTHRPIDSSIVRDYPDQPNSITLFVPLTPPVIHSRIVTSLLPRIRLHLMMCLLITHDYACGCPCEYEKTLKECCKNHWWSKCKKVTEVEGDVLVHKCMSCTGRDRIRERKEKGEGRG